MINKDTRMFDVINSVDEGESRNNVVEELSAPIFLIGSAFTVNKLIDKMISLKLLRDESGFLTVTSKGKKFHDSDLLD